MNTVLLLLTLVSQPDPTLKDFAFNVAVEQSIIADKKLDISPAKREILTELDAPTYKKREKAYRQLCKLKNYRVALWAFRSKTTMNNKVIYLYPVPVRLYCNMYLRQVSLCSHCLGKGQCNKDDYDRNLWEFEMFGDIDQASNKYIPNMGGAVCVKCVGEGRWWIRAVEGSEDIPAVVKPNNNDFTKVMAE